MQRSFSNSISSENQTEKRLDSTQFYDIYNNTSRLKEEETGSTFGLQNQSCSESVDSNISHINKYHTTQETNSNNFSLNLNSSDPVINSLDPEVVSCNGDLQEERSSDEASLETAKYLDCYKSLVAGNSSSVGLKLDDHYSRKSSIGSTLSQYDENSTLN